MTSTNPHETADLMAHLDGDHTAVDSVAALAYGSADAQQVDPRGIYLANSSDGTKTVVDLADRKRALDKHPPVRKTGDYTFTETDSLIGYLAKHGRDETEVWGSDKSGTIRAVIDAHDEATPGHEMHTATLRLTHTQDWQEWTKSSGRAMTQVEFAEFIEDHLPNIVEPSAGDMLTIAQSLEAKKSVDFKASTRLQDGNIGLQWEETTTARAGGKGQLEIPQRFALGIQVYEGMDAWRITARLRYRIHEGGRLTLSYILDRPDDARREAFSEAVAKVQEGSGYTVWATT